ncbi:hypothetical protein [Halobaculum rarum]|uniref:hypothetical protein n=1 Tax=Halobaculum rarum TaxID=3075122 RepID=UPI0032B00A3F
MALPAVLGIPDSTLGMVLGAAWLVVLGVAVYQYVSGNRSREQVYMVVCMGSFWLAYSLLQVSNTVSGTGEIGIVILAAGLFLVGIGAGLRWREIRSSGTEESAVT